MGTRAEDLDLAAIETAERLKIIYGNFKRVLSAGILALDWLPDDYQKTFLARAGGHDCELPSISEDAVRRYLLRIVELDAMLSRKSGRDQQAMPAKLKRSP